MYVKHPLLNVFKELIFTDAEAPVNPTETEWRRAE
jgi:hypothetical protein